MANNLIICFGPTENDYLITYARFLAYSNVPKDIVEALSEEELNPMRIGWIQAHENFETMVLMNWISGAVSWTECLPEELQTYIAPPGITGAVRYFTFADSDDGFFIKFRPGGGPDGRSWIMNVRPDYPDQIEALMSEIPDFSDRLRFILFGHGGTHIYVFDTGFCAHFEGEAKDPEHPLNKIVHEFMEPGWTIADGSTLSLYDSSFFCLTFVHTETQEEHTKFYIPISMHKILTDLVERSKEPAESLAIQRYLNVINKEYENNAGILSAAVHTQATQSRPRVAVVQQTTTSIIMF